MATNQYFNHHGTNTPENILIEKFVATANSIIYNNANKKIIQTSSNKIKIAILPFDNLSKDEDSEFLVEGIFRDLSLEFSRMQEFDVMSHQACLDFKNSAENALAFAKKHKIDFLVGGNVRSAGKRIRVSVDLTDALDGSSVYGTSTGGSGGGGGGSGPGQ